LGASYLSVDEKSFYDTKVVEDPLAKASKKTGGSLASPNGDGEVWAEKMYRNKSGKTKIFFVSKQTGEKVEEEPPTGASRVMYLRQSYKSKNEEPTSSPKSSITSPKEDGEVWVEKIFRNKSGETKIFFVSKQTGKKVEKEPPSGASRVMYLRQSYKSRNEEPTSSPSSSSKKSETM